MSPGDQLVNIFISGVGTLLTALINALFGAFVTPAFQAIATFFGLPV